MRQQLNELEITDSNKLFFVGTIDTKYDLTAQKFVDYKALDKLTVESAAFGTSTYGYALAYAKQYGNQQKRSGVVVAFELKPGLQFFNLRDPEDYVKLGLPVEIANVFKDCESYFALNSNVPNTQQFVVPIEYKIAMKQLYRSKKSNETLLDAIMKFDHEHVNSSYFDMYVEQMKRVFKSIFGKKTADYLKALSTQHFDSLEELLDNFETPSSVKFDAEKYELNRQLKQQYKNEFFADTGARVMSDADFGRWLKKKYNKSLPTANKYKIYPINSSSSQSPAQWKYRYKGDSAWLKYPVELEDSAYKTLFDNYKLLYANKPENKQNNPDYDFSPIDGSDFLHKKLDGYFKLFEVCKEYINRKISEPTFRSGIKKIQSRLNSDTSAESTHIYIDLLQYVWFNRLIDNTQFIGVFCPEARGYAHIHKFSGHNADKELCPYAYEKAINAKTIYLEDKTVIICKPLTPDMIKTYGHTIDFANIDGYFVNKDAKRTITKSEFNNVILPKIKAVTSLDGYKKIYQDEILARITN